MKRLIRLLKDTGFTHVEIAGKTMVKGDVLPAVLGNEKGIYIIITDRNITQCEWEVFSSSSYSDPVLLWNSFGLPMSDGALYVGMSEKNLKGEIDRHIRGHSYDTRSLKLANYRCPEFSYIAHAFFLDPEKGSNQVNLDNLEAFVKKYLKPVIGRV